jgi:hypothetical protein
VKLVAAAAILVALVLPRGADASFGFLPGTAGFDADVLKQDGTPENRAGVHPGSLRIHLERTMAGQFGDGDLRDLQLELPSGFLLNPVPIVAPGALSRLDSCSPAEFRTPRVSPFESSLSGESCPDGSQVGVVAVRSSYGGGTTRHLGVFNLDPPYGSPLALGFAPYGVPIVFTADVREADAGLTLILEDLSQAYDFQTFDLTIWGTPWAHSHDAQRGNCLAEPSGGSHGDCQVPGFPTPKSLEDATKSLLTLPTSCAGPMRWRLSARSWQGETAAPDEVLSRNEKGDPLPVVECKNAATKAHMRLSTDRAATGSGLFFDLDVNDGGGILNPGGIARPSIRTARIELPEGLTLNPSLGNGLGVCAKTEFEREAVDTPPGGGCPNASKIGIVEVDGMMGQAQSLSGSLFLAAPYDNPFGTLLAVYMVAAAPQRGLFVKATGKVELDPGSGRMTMTFEDLPQLLYTHFGLQFRAGQRPALVAPPACGAYTMQMDLRAWGRPAVLLQDSDSFTIAAGETGAPCVAGATVPFGPGVRAGSVAPQAGASSPFFLNLTRADADQEITSYSTRLPPGVLGRIAGVPFCPDAAVEAARTRTGTAELQSPSCPAASAIGHTLSGYGVGAILAYAPGQLYLAGPYRGAPLSVVAVDSALIGPFDLGTVVVRSAIRVDPRSALVTIDSSASDPIPHILTGVPLHLRDIRLYVDRPGFMVNPTSCERFSVTSTMTGSAAPFTDPRAALATVAVPYQAFNCGSLGFAPRVALKLSGGVKRGSHQTLKVAIAPRAGDANIARTTVTLPPSVFLAQENIRDICSRAQFAADACPARSVVGAARANTPLLEAPLQGPVYLRASDNPLPDLVAVLRGRGVPIVLEGRVDSHRGGLRGRFAGLPDAPVSRFEMTIFGGRKRGILVSAENLCRSVQRAEVRLQAQHNSISVQQPKLRTKCAKKGKRDRARGRGR